MLRLFLLSLSLSVSNWIIIGFLYAVVGAVAVIATAYIYKLTTDRDYMIMCDWWDEWNRMPPAGLVFALWPLVIPLTIIGWSLVGFFKAITGLADQATKLAEKQRKAVGDRRNNP